MAGFYNLSYFNWLREISRRMKVAKIGFSRLFTMKSWQINEKFGMDSLRRRKNPMIYDNDNLMSICISLFTLWLIYSLMLIYLQSSFTLWLIYSLKLIYLQSSLKMINFLLDTVYLYFRDFRLKEYFSFQVFLVGNTVLCTCVILSCRCMKYWCIIKVIGFFYQVTYQTCVGIY